MCAVVSVKKLHRIRHLMVFTVFFFLKTLYFIQLRWKMKIIWGKMYETKVVPYDPNYSYIFSFFGEIPKMKELGPENVFFFIINQSITQTRGFFWWKWYKVQMMQFRKKDNIIVVSSKSVKFKILNAHLTI